MSVVDTPAAVDAVAPSVPAPTVAPAAPPGGRRRGSAAATLVGLLRKPTLVLSALVVLVVVLWALVPGLFSGYDPLYADTSQVLLPPSFEHLFGTDELGRDVFTRMVHGTALTLLTTVVAVVIGFAFGSVIGLAAGYFGRIADGVLMRVVDILLAIPMLVLAMAIVTAIGFGSVQLAIGVGIGMIGSVARVMRSEVMRVRQSTFIDAERSMGARDGYIIARHVLPNAVGPVLVLAILDFGAAILTIAALSFLGYGTPPPTPEWGSLVASGRAYLTTAWWMSTLPGLTIAVFVVCINRIARELQNDRSSR
ncbi:ABC transporter permease [Herbiconiux moechotypicola]|uniref:ABC transporter permease n=1 Tax=Herbiconiux moechotypicola TaxID=637393 RepID=A0ABN3DSM4_9MICO|nr:ABC transporter permease [Herbiconiux moechotypicola]MCS5730598.1 ABC transporter permease [Herbiconiux moechotypicola]